MVVVEVKGERRKQIRWMCSLLYYNYRVSARSFSKISVNTANLRIESEESVILSLRRICWTGGEVAINKEITRRLTNHHDKWLKKRKRGGWLAHPPRIYATQQPPKLLSPPPLLGTYTWTTHCLPAPRPPPTPRDWRPLSAPPQMSALIFLPRETSSVALC